MSIQHEEIRKDMEVAGKHLCHGLKKTMMTTVIHVTPGSNLRPQTLDAFCMRCNK